MKRNRPWTQEEMERLPKLLKHFGISRAARILKRPFDDVRAKACDLGIAVYATSEHPKCRRWGPR